MLAIEITKAEVQTRNVPARNDRQGWTAYSQDAYLHQPGETYPTKFTITLDADQEPYPKGMYTLDTVKSVYINQYGGLAFARRVKLNPSK